MKFIKLFFVKIFAVLGSIIVMMMTIILIMIWHLLKMVRNIFKKFQNATLPKEDLNKSSESHPLNSPNVSQVETYS